LAFSSYPAHEVLLPRCTTPFGTRIISLEYQLPLEGFNWLPL
jgi:hypothetical protein